MNEQRLKEMCESFSSRVKITPYYHMGYDIIVYDWDEHCDCCGRHGEEWEFNYTYNIRPLLDYIGITFLDLEGIASGIELVKTLETMLERLTDKENIYALNQLEPSNGWGSRLGLIDVLRKILATAKQVGHPRLGLL